MCTVRLQWPSLLHACLPTCHPCPPCHACPPATHASPLPRMPPATYWSINIFGGIYYWPQRSCGQGNIFTPVCHSVNGGGVSASVHTGMPHHPLQSRHAFPEQTHPPEQTPPRNRHPPRSRHPPGTDMPPLGQTPPPPWSRHTPCCQTPPGADTPLPQD